MNVVGVVFYPWIDQPTKERGLSPFLRPFLRYGEPMSKLSLYPSMWAMQTFAGRASCVALAVIIAALLTFYLWLDGLSVLRPDVIELSYSRQFIVERVPVNVLFPAEKMSYLRVTDQDHARDVYRSPLCPTRLLDMTVTETVERVGLPHVSFYIKGKYFVLDASCWEDSWLNGFISNTVHKIKVPVGERYK